MRVIFLEDVPGSGRAGDVKEVKNGYARNFLLPRKLAAPATHDQLQRIEILRKAAEERRIKEEQDLTVLAEHLSRFTVSLTAKMSPTGRFYGAVTPAQIAEELSRLAEREIDRRIVHLAQPIHEPGEYQVELRFAHGIVAAIQAQVAAEGAAQPDGATQQATAETIQQLEQAEVAQPDATEATVQLEEAEEAAVQPESVAPAQPVDTTEHKGNGEETEEPEEGEES